jgi:two-component system sensor histidine kinase KdpD
MRIIFRSDSRTSCAWCIDLIDDERPKPEELITRINAEEKKKGKGKLKVFFGYAPGVGKTYSMLQNAIARRNEKVDVVLGYVDPHGRKETEVLMEGFETIPPKVIDYHGIKIPEMDLDAIIKRHPQLVIVDELAHTNAPLSRHPKRYQDVLEILDAGIDVYTTLNVQHLESVNDIVMKTVGVQVQETLPDLVLDEADEVNIVDISPEELIKRLKSGKVYVPSQIGIALDNFFSVENLTALREITFRTATERVDDEMREYLAERTIQGPYAAGERLLVCIGNNYELSKRLIRTTRRIAHEGHMEWHAIYVETPAQNRLFKRNREGVLKSMQLAESLGAKVTTLFGISVAEEAVRYAKKNNITRIIIGRPLRPRWSELFFRSVVDDVIRMSGPIDVYVVSQGAKVPHFENISFSPKFTHILYSAGLVALISVLALLVYPAIEITNVAMLYLLVVVASSVLWGLFSAIVTSVMSVLAFDFLFVPPRFSLILSTQYVITFIGMSVVAVVISYFVVRAKETAQVARTSEYYTATLYDLSQSLVASADEKSMALALEDNVKKAFGWDSTVLLKSGEELKPVLDNEKVILNDQEMAVATWAHVHRQVSGFETDNIPAAKLRYYPIRTSTSNMGVLGIMTKSSEDQIKPEQSRIIQAFATQAAIALDALERTRLVDIKYKQ